MSWKAYTSGRQPRFRGYKSIFPQIPALAGNGAMGGEFVSAGAITARESQLPARRKKWLLASFEGCQGHFDAPKLAARCLRFSQN
jgi:hypothetical protein